MQRFLLIFGLSLGAIYFTISYFWLRVDYQLTTGIDFIILDDVAKVRRIHKPNVTNCSVVATDVEMTSDNGPLAFSEYYLNGTYDYSTCDSGPDCNGPTYMHLRDCMIVPAFIIDGTGLLALLSFAMGLMKTVQRSKGNQP